MRAPRFELDARKAQSVLFGKDFIVQPRLLHAAALPPDHVGLVFHPVMEQQIFQCPGLFRRTSGQDGQICLLHLSLSHRLRQPCGLLRRLCVDHHAADRLVEPVDGENLTPQLLGEQLRHRLRLRALCGCADGLDADEIARCFLQNFNHMLRLSFGAILPEKYALRNGLQSAETPGIIHMNIRNGANIMTTEQYRKRSGFSIFLSFFKPHRGLFFLDMACALVVSMIDLAYPIISRYAMRTLLPQSAYRTFFTIMLIVLAAYALRSVLYFIITYWGHTFGIRVEADIRAALFGHMQELGFEFFDRNRTGQLMSRMTTDLFEITELAHHGPEDLFISLVTIVGALTVMATIEWRLALVVAVMIPVFIAIIVSRRKAMREASRRVKKKTGAINADIESALSGIRTAKAFANEHVEEEKFDRSNDIYKTSKKMFHREMGIFMAVMEFFTSSLSVAVVTVGGLLIMKGQMDTVDLLTFTLYIASFVNPIRKLANFTELFSNGTAGFERFLEIMRTAPELHDAPDALELTHVRGEIGVENVSFSYEDDPEVLHDVSLHVPAGKTVAIVGPSGGGKSTLCQLIPRFYDVTGGSITVDGHDVRSVTQESLRRSIGIVQQDVFLFADSILENIRYGKPGATMEEIVEAAKRAEIYDDIMAMPDGFDTYVGERGTLLSGGQKQRISIARIFLKNPPILILDEATSALDTLTEAKIQHAFDELAKNRTTLIIAHRLSTIRAAGEIVVIADGRIAERGTNEELLKKDGIYASLCRTQNLLA